MMQTDGMSEVVGRAVDLDQLQALLASRRSELGLSLRELSAATGVPVSTLSRVEKGHMPDLTTFRNIVDWLGVPAERFFPSARVRDESVPEAFKGMLHGDRTLSKDAKKQLASIVEQMYAALSVQANPVTVHLRAHRTFTPEAGELLASLIEQMQRRLIDGFAG